jgi:hypothetical protein
MQYSQLLRLGCEVLVNTIQSLQPLVNTIQSLQPLVNIIQSLQPLVNIIQSLQPLVKRLEKLIEFLLQGFQSGFHAGRGWTLYDSCTLVFWSRVIALAFDGVAQVTNFPTLQPEREIQKPKKLLLVMAMVMMHTNGSNILAHSVIFL